MMNRVIIIGCPGAGKSTFARKLSEKTGLPLFYLDMIWHKADRTNVTTDEFDAVLYGIMSGEQWIIDGNYLRTMPERLKKADTVFFFDMPVDVCLAGAIERLGKAREDMPWKEDELDEEFRQWILDFPESQLPVIQLLLESFQGNTMKSQLIKYQLVVIFFCYFCTTFAQQKPKISFKIHRHSSSFTRSSRFCIFLTEFHSLTPEPYRRQYGFSSCGVFSHDNSGADTVPCRDRHV